MTGITVKTFIEKRDEIKVVKWMGEWSEAHEFAALYPGAIGFEVDGTSLVVHFEDELNSFILVRGTRVQIKPGWPGNGAWVADRILTESEMDKWQVK